MFGFLLLLVIFIFTANKTMETNKQTYKYMQLCFYLPLSFISIITHRFYGSETSCILMDDDMWPQYVLNLEVEVLMGMIIKHYNLCLITHLSLCCSEVFYSIPEGTSLKSQL